MWFWPTSKSCQLRIFSRRYFTHRIILGHKRILKCQLATPSWWAEAHNTSFFSGRTSQQTSSRTCSRVLSNLSTNECGQPKYGTHSWTTSLVDMVKIPCISHELQCWPSESGYGYSNYNSKYIQMPHGMASSQASGARLFAACGHVAAVHYVRSGRAQVALGPHQGHVSAVCAGEKICMQLWNFEVSRASLMFMLKITYVIPKWVYWMYTSEKGSQKISCCIAFGMMLEDDWSNSSYLVRSTEEFLIWRWRGTVLSSRNDGSGIIQKIVTKCNLLISNMQEYIL